MATTIVERTATTGTAASGATLTFTLPTGTVQGDMLLAVFGHTSGLGGVNPPAGWKECIAGAAGSSFAYSGFCAPYNPSLSLTFTAVSSVIAGILQAYSFAETSFGPLAGGTSMSGGFVDTESANASSTTNNTTMPTAAAVAHQGGDHAITVFAWGDGSLETLNALSGWAIDAQTHNSTSVGIALAHFTTTPSLAQGASVGGSNWTLTAASANKGSKTVLLSVPQEPFQIRVGPPVPVLAQ